MKKLVKVTAAAGAALVLGLLPSAPAFADQGSAITGAQAYYTSGNDQLSAQDTAADSKSAIAEIRSSPTGAVTSLVNSGGNGTITYKTVNIGNFQIRACVQNLSSGGAKTCSAWKDGS